MILRALFGVGGVLLLVPCNVEHLANACVPAVCETAASDQVLTRVGNVRASILAKAGRIRFEMIEADKRGRNLEPGRLYK